MNNKIIKKVINLVVAFVATIGLFAGTVTAQAVEVSNKNKQPLQISINYAEKLGKGHTTPGALGQLSSDMERMWKELPITVIDGQGHELEVKKELNGHCERTVGNFANGEKVTIKVDTSKLPDDYHLSWESDYTYPKPIKNYSQFQVVVDSSMPVRISLAKMKVKFDLQGGNINGNTKSIVKFVNKNNGVDFPSDPTKDDLVFGGWFTELPNTESYKKLGIVGKRYYWNSKSLFSDYSCDWMSYNDTNTDPLYDGVFLLRAQWNAKVSFDANGGAFSNAKQKISALRRQGLKIKILAAPTREDYQFLNWVDAAGKAYKPGDMYTLNANTAFTAQWKQIRSTVTFKDGDKTQTVKVETGKAIDMDALKDQSMPKNPTKDGYTFKEWNTKADGKGTAFTGKTIVNSDTTVYAIFTKNLKPAPTPDPILPAPFEPESGMENPLSVPESQTPETKQELSHAPKSEHEHNTAHEYVKSPVVEHKTEKHVPDMPKTGESASVVALISALGFAIAGFAVVRLRRVFEAKFVR
ncbi:MULTISPECIES: InlB B-repeat-containing protein [Gardnerella]|uniref:InlB B-repeat-containing protein n=1 Tax=Gardnerella TaxID=2701 RepID=UPI0015741D51|nr:InlB B-repeat-containing protein [Gardnerella vaginalis]